ncbi:hypothetical protein [Ewingella americana]|uniref:hypothetical protein n=1 Tax=Ewingella americana TaxID=41202 RepID=UPI00188477A5|nr:hypothetical protein [Ewingella americana]
MKTFGNTKAGQASNNFVNIKDEYWREANVVHRASAEKHAIRMSIISFLRPMRTHSAELLSGKTFPTACLSFNPETEEFDKGRCPFCEWEYGAAVNYLVLVFVHNWFENPASNPAPEKGPVAILELTKDMIGDITTINETWGLDPENGGICDPTCNVMLSLTAARKGGKANAPIQYTVQGVPAPIAITHDWLNENYESGAFTKWDLERYAQSKMMRASDLLPFLAYNGYSKEIEWFDGLAADLLTRNDHFNNLAASEEEAEAWNSQLGDTDEDKRETRFVYLGEKGIRNRTEKGLQKFLADNAAQNPDGGYTPQSNFEGSSAGGMGFGNGQQAGSTPAPSAPPAASRPSAPAAAAPAANKPAPAPAANKPAPAPAAAAAAPKPAAPPAASLKPAAAPKPGGAQPLAAPKPNL